MITSYRDLLEKLITRKPIKIVRKIGIYKEMVIK